MKINRPDFFLATLLGLAFLLIQCTEKEPLPTSSFASLDGALSDKMGEFNVPSISIAIIKDEKLVYERSYGFSDKEENTAATVNDLYRIASISKPVTAIAILKLVQDGSLSLDEKVFGEGGILGNDYGTPPAGSNKDLITVRHLLNHSSGWTNTPNDPMFHNLAHTQAQLISDLLANRPLTHAPGATYSYLNFGYCILGRVIEKLSSLSYEEYVKTNILEPCGISRMRISGNTLNERYAHEVKYYQDEFSPYAMNVRRLDAAGGWIASAKDLARFMVKIDRNTAKSDLISTSLLNELYFTYPNWYHYGSLPGTSTILRRLDDTYSFVVLANTRTESDPSLIINELDELVTREIRSISSWPTTDLF